MHTRTVKDSQSKHGCSSGVLLRAVVTVTASPYDEPLSQIREHVENLAAWIAVWEHRAEPDAHARRCASDAVDAVDAMLTDLYLVRGRLVSEIRWADDEVER
jgi:hypothetical protein